MRYDFYWRILPEISNKNAVPNFVPNSVPQKQPKTPLHRGAHGVGSFFRKYGFFFVSILFSMEKWGKKVQKNGASDRA